MSLTKRILIAIVGITLGILLGMGVSSGYDAVKANPLSKLAPTPPVKKLGAFIRLLDPNSRTVCSGTVVSDTYLITAAHCLGGVASPEGMVVIADEFYKSTTLTKVAAWHPDVDYAVLMGDFKAYEHIKVNKHYNAKPGDKLKAIGFPRMGTRHESTGTALSYFNFFIAARDMNIIPGMSGGALLNEAGELVGINSRVMGDLQMYVQLVNIDSMTGLGL